MQRWNLIELEYFTDEQIYCVHEFIDIETTFEIQIWISYLFMATG